MSSGGDYKPTEHDGLKQDGTPDLRVKGNRSGDDETESETNVQEPVDDTTESTGEIYKPSEHDGLKKDGTPDKRVNPEHGFGGRPHEEVVEAARKGGKASHGGSD